MGVGDFDTKAAIIVRDDLAQSVGSSAGLARFSSVSRIRTLTAAEQAVTPCDRATIGDLLKKTPFEYESWSGARDLNPGPHGPEPS